MAERPDSADTQVHPGADTEPSYRPERVAVLALAIVGCAIAGYLTAYQLGRVAAPWDPVFGAGSSERVLTSSLTRALPVPDAALGAVGYLVEIALVAVGGASRWRVRPRLVIVYGVVVAGMALVSLGLILMQAFVVHAGCALCLASALISIVNVVLARGEVGASIAVARGDAATPDPRSSPAPPSSRREAA